MKTRRIALISALVIAGSLAACSPDEVPTESDTAATENSNDLATRAGAPLFDGMGEHHHPITTKDADAQRYFDQGVIIDFAFNHAESVRSFKAAQTLDPECAMCFWGEALALGPNINVTSNGKVVMSDDERSRAYAAIQKALGLGVYPMQVLKNEDERLIEALAQEEFFEHLKRALAAYLRVHLLQAGLGVFNTEE